MYGDHVARPENCSKTNSHAEVAVKYEKQKKKERKNMFTNLMDAQKIQLNINFS